MHVNRQGAAHHRILNPKVLIPADTANPAAKGYDPDLVIPAEGAARAAAMAALEKFCDVFPAAFLVSERTSTWLAKNQTGRLLSAGFHSAMGYFRDDRPLYELILDDDGRRELDELWRELDFVTNAPARQLAGFVWFERTDSDFMLSSEFNHLRAEDQDLASEAKFAELRRLYEAKVAASGVAPDVRAMVTLYFDELGSAIRWTEQARREAEPRHRESLVAFAARAYRRPLEAAERQDLLAFYSRLRKDGLTHEDAMRDGVASVLVSPQFLYRVDLARTAAPSRSGSHLVAPLTDFSACRQTELLPLVEHAGRGAVGACRSRRPAAARRAGRTGPSHAPGRAEHPAGDRVRDQLARRAALRGVQQRRPRAVSNVHQRPEARRSSRSRFDSCAP